jgi:hypothetical protein
MKRINVIATDQDIEKAVSLGTSDTVSITSLSEEEQRRYRKTYNLGPDEPAELVYHLEI